METALGGHAGHLLSPASAASLLVRVLPQTLVSAFDCLLGAVITLQGWRRLWSSSGTCQLSTLEGFLTHASAWDFPGRDVRV